MSKRDFVVRLANVTKLFPAGNRQYSLLRTVLRRRAQGDTFAALHAIDLELRRGDRVGLIGNNGAGKSTLLRVVAGLHPPTTGSVELHGRPTLLAGLGVGMVDDLNVEHNIFLYGSMHGIMRKDLKLKIDEILQWAELTDFRHAILKNLSTGMRSRLAFSVTRYFDSDIYLLDEALTAGDRVFRERCDDVFASYAPGQRTMLVASHDMKFVRRHCNKVLWLQRGRQMGFGPMEDVLPLYEATQAVKR